MASSPMRSQPQVVQWRFFIFDGVSLRYGRMAFEVVLEFGFLRLDLA